MSRRHRGKTFSKLTFLTKKKVYQKTIFKLRIDLQEICIQKPVTAKYERAQYLFRNFIETF